ncbi:hypothetical protein U91I_04136 [alpha proteobacterium U9-1i]|nr:hypothetical protein U91I_04136 [alpha proteobacterium U9-1i]
MNRRALLLSVGAVAACGSSQTRTPALDIAAPTTIVDAHTHVFNATDLSVQEFISVVVFKNYNQENLPPECRDGKPQGRALGGLLKSTLQGIAPSARVESARIDRGAQDGPPDPEEDVFEDEERQNAADEAARNGYKDALANRLEAMDRATSGHDGNTPARLLLSDIDIAAGGSGLDGRPLSQRQKMDRIVREEAPTDIGRYLDWGFWLSRSRSRIIKRFKSVYQRQSVSHFVGLMVDYEHWLGEAPHERSTTEDQITVMHKLRTRLHPGLQSFAPFDPLREALEGVRRPAQPTSLDRLKEHWRQQRIQGVKIYPPMGFRPTDNVGLEREHPGSGSPFPTHVVEQWNRARGADARTLGRALDDAMLAFFTWAATEQVPITTHSGNSVDAGCRFAERGHPAQWAKVFASPSEGGLGLANLRLCLGHFDSVSDFLNKPGESWGRLKGPLLRYPNVYVDLSFMEEFVSEDADQAAQVRRFFTALRDYARTSGDPDFRKLLYGSDWIMFERIPNRERYFDNIARGFSQAAIPADALRNFSSENAKRFLRLSA